MTVGAIERLTTALAERYRLERELGQGGMATVYLAEDVRHHRKVAIKVLHPELSAVLGPERFLKEIELTANLQHPHILPLFDSGTADGLLYYVMPFVAGESLRTRLQRERQLPVTDAVRIATDVAGALEYAHRRGIVHRDIKPENILLQDGRPVMADFGIALAVQEAGGSRMTQTGMSIGTPQYMAPEQAMGERNLDARSDVYALGCVLYEMLAGEPPFTGPTAQAIVARVMTETPRPLRLQRHTVPEQVEAAVLRALEKLPADRFAKASEFAEALGRQDDIAEQRSRAARYGAGRPDLVSAWLRRIPWVVAGAGIAIAAWALSRTSERPTPAVISYTLTPPDQMRILDVGGSPVAVRPDGTGLVYVGFMGPGRPRQLVRWQFDGSLPEPIAGTENPSFPFFSPDGEWLAFVRGSEFRKVSTRGGGVTTIGSTGGAVGIYRGATWTSAGQIVFATSSGLHLMPADGGPIRQILSAAQSGQMAFFPDAFGTGDHVLVAMLSSLGSVATELGVVSVATGEITRLGLAGSNPHYIEPGYLAFTSLEGALQAVRFDPRARKILSRPRPIAQSVSLGTAGVGKLALSRNGVVAFLEGSALEERQLLRLDRKGTARVLDAPARTYNGPRISPDGNRIAVTIGAVPNPPMDLWVFDLTVGTLERVTFDSTSVHGEWSSDGRRLYHRRAAGGHRAMATVPDGSAPPESLYSTTSDLWEVIPSRSGDTILIRELMTAENDRDLLLVPVRPAGPAVPWAGGPRIQAEPVFSPDGKWVAYTSDESGSAEVYIKAFPGPGPRYLVSSGGGIAPRWNPRGGEVFYLSDSLVAVSVQSRGETLELGRGRSLFSVQGFTSLNFHAPYDVSPDGSWFVFVGNRNGGQAQGLRIIHHWFDQQASWDQ